MCSYLVSIQHDVQAVSSCGFDNTAKETDVVIVIAAGLELVAEPNARPRARVEHQAGDGLVVLYVLFLPLQCFLLRRFFFFSGSVAYCFSRSHRDKDGKRSNRSSVCEPVFQSNGCYK